MSTSESDYHRVAIVTGATGGIGRALCLRLAKEGFNVMASDLSSRRDDLESLVKEIQSTKNIQARAISCCTDVSEESDVQELVSKTVAEFGGLGVMVANAGVCTTSPLTKMSENDWDRIFSVNAKGAFLCYKAAAIQMIKQGKGGRIIGASSTGGKRGEMELGAYCASKFAIRGLTQATASELFDYGITVNAYAPGGVDTPMLHGIIAERKEKGFDPHPIFEEKAQAVFIPPEHIAGLVAYLIKDESKHITGQTICINRGAFYD